jgi:hypothetical protein
MKSFVLAIVLCLAGPAWADGVTAPVVAEGIGTSPVVPDLGTLVDGEADVSVLPEQARDIARAIDDVRVKRTNRLMLWAALLAAIFKLLLSGVKITGGMPDFWKGERGKAALRLTTLGFGGLVYLASTLAMGMSWWEALLLAMSGPASMIIHEYSRLIPGLKK